MTLKFTWLATSKQWAVFGPADEMKLGLVDVERGNGEVKTERVVKLSRPFEQDGEQRRLGFIAVLPWWGART